MARTRPVPRRSGAALVTLCLVLLALLLSAPGAQAHAELTGSSPGDGTELSGSPAGLRPSQVVATLPELPAATYRLSWQTVSADDLHRASGTVTFGVRRASVAAGPTEALPGSLEAGLRWLLLLGVALVLGGALAAHALSGAAGLEHAVRRTQRLALAGGVGAALVGCGLLGAQLLGSGIGVRELAGSGYGARWLAREAGLLTMALATVAARGPRPQPPARALLLMGAALTGVGTALLGHAGADAHLDVTRVLATAVHLCAALTWAGAVGCLALAVGPLVAAGGPGRAGAREALRSFGLPAAGCVTVAVVSGVYLSSSVVGSVDAALRTFYGRALLLKVGLVVLVGLVASVNHVRLRERHRDGVPVRTVRLEALLAVVVVAVTAVLSSGQPATEPQLVDAAGRAARAVLVSTAPLAGTLRLAAAVAGATAAAVWLGVLVVRRRRSRHATSQVNRGPRHEVEVSVALSAVLLVLVASAVSHTDPARVTLAAAQPQPPSAAQVTPIRPGTPDTVPAYASPLSVYAPTADRAAGGAVDLPRILFDAYAAAVAGAPPGCNLRISLLAAIGTVESGSLDGSTIDAGHRAHVLGPLLNGSGFKAIPDTDNGRWDGSTRWDRAVGPMQFIPATWRTYGRDGDHDGVTDPQDIEDSAAGAAAYLCSGGRDLSRPADLRAAVLAYNHSAAYLELVQTLMARFDSVGLRPVDDTGPTTLTSILRATATAARSDRPAVRHWVRAAVRLAAGRKPDRAGPSALLASSPKGGITGAASPGALTSGAPSAAPTPTPSAASAAPSPASLPGTSSDGPSGSPTGSDPAPASADPTSRGTSTAEPPSQSPTSGASDPAPASDPPASAPEPAQTPSATDTPSAPAADPAPATSGPPVADPSCLPATDPALTTDPAPTTDPTPSDPAPAPTCPTDPAAVTEQLVTDPGGTATGASASAGP